MSLMLLLLIFVDIPVRQHALKIDIALMLSYMLNKINK